MKRLVLAICMLVGAAAGPASAANLCVGPGAGCFPTLQAAVNAQKKASKVKDNKAKLRSAISKVIVRNPLLQQAAKDIFNKMK